MKNRSRLSCFLLLVLVLCQVGAIISMGGQEQRRDLPHYSRRDMNLKELPDAEIRSQLQDQMRLKGTGFESEPRMHKLRLELAIRGDRTIRRQLYEDLRGTDLRAQARAMSDISQFGDKEAIVRLVEMLNDPSPARRVSHDEILLPPRLFAIMLLANVVPDPPVPPLGPNKHFYTDEDVEIWKEWWEKHRHRYLPESAEEKESAP